MAKPVRVDHSSSHHSDGNNFSNVAPRGPSPTEQFIQGIVYAIIGVGLLVSGLGLLPSALGTAAAYYVPQWVMFGGAMGFICCSVICFMGAKGAAYNSPLYKPLSFVQIISLGILFCWFVFGDNHMPFGGRLAAGIILGFLLVIFAFGTIVQIFFPRALENMVRNNPEMEAKYRELKSRQDQQL